MGNTAEKECFHFKKKYFQADILPPVLRCENKEINKHN